MDEFEYQFILKDIITTDNELKKELTGKSIKIISYGYHDEYLLCEELDKYIKLINPTVRGMGLDDVCVHDESNSYILEIIRDKRGI